MTKILFTSDLHLTDRFRDEYRWEIFRKLHEVGKDRNVDAVALLGDITDAKEGHGARLVDRMSREIDKLAQSFEVYILKGNHDYADESKPFFGFLDLLNNVTFQVEPGIVSVAGVPCLGLPHAHHGQVHGSKGQSDNQVTGDKVTKLLKAGGYEMVFMHQTLVGSTLGNGTKSQHGLQLDSRITKEKRLNDWCYYRDLDVPLLAGDVHVPQQVGPLTYCGAPYPVAFGDSWQPRLLLWEDGKLSSIPIASIKKHSLRMVGAEACESLSDDVMKGDQVKVTVFLNRLEIHLWPRLRDQLFRLANEREATIESLSVECVDSALIPGTRSDSSPLTAKPDEVLKQYCDDNSLDAQLVAYAERILRN